MASRTHPILFTIPPEILLIIIGLLEDSSLVNLYQTCKSFQKTLQSERNKRFIDGSMVRKGGLIIEIDGSQISQIRKRGFLIQRDERIYFNNLPLQQSGRNYSESVQIWHDEGYFLRTIIRGQYDSSKAFLDLYMAQESCKRIDLRSLMDFVIAAGNARMLKLLIERGVHNHDPPSNPSILSHALSCKLGRTEVLETLIAAGEGIDSETMGTIISKGSCKAIRMAVARGLPFKIDRELLWVIISRNDPDVLLIFLPLIISDGVLNEQIQGSSPLNRALLHPIPRLAVPFIKAGIDIDAMDRNGETALHGALLGRHFDIAIILITAGCRLNVARQDFGNELHHAIRPNKPFDDSDDSDSDSDYNEIDYSNSLWGDCPADGYPENEIPIKWKPASLLTTVYLLLARGVDIDLHSHSSNDPSRGVHLETLLWHAIELGCRDVVWAILTMGVRRPDLTITDAAGRTPLQFAQERGNRHIIRMLKGYEESPWKMFSGLSDVSMEDA